MKDNVLLINSSYQPRWSCSEPNGLMYISASLENNGFNTNIIDLNTKTKKTINDIVDNIEQNNIKIVGISAITRQALNAYKIGNILKQKYPDIILIYGGIHPTFMPKESFDLGSADYVVIGEGEKTIINLLDNIDNGEDIKNIKGLAYRNGEDIVVNDSSNYINELDNIPFPDYEKINFEDYNTNIHVPGNKGLAVNIMSSRGCKGTCYYCSSPALYKCNVRFRSLDNIIDEIKYLIDNHKIENIHFIDDNFMSNKKRLLEFTEKVKINNLKFNWICLSSVKSVIDNEDILNILKESGCQGMEIGVESGDPKVLSKLDKDLSLEKVKYASTILKKEGIFPMYLMMSYTIGETINSSFKSAKLFYELRDNVEFQGIPEEKEEYEPSLAGHLARPSPGSVFYKIANKQGITLADNWDDHIEDGLSFLPNTFLNDIPNILQIVSKSEFINYFERFKQNIALYANQNFYISKVMLNNYFGASVDEFIDYMYQIYSRINGKSDIKQIILDLESKNIKESYTKVSGVISILSIFGFINGTN